MEDKNETLSEISVIPEKIQHSEHHKLKKDDYDRRINSLEPQVMAALALQREAREYLLNWYLLFYIHPHP
jgi:hypothetical protein